MQYHNFDIWIDEKDKAGLEYHLRAETKTFDSAPGLLRLDPVSTEVTNALEKFAQRDTDRQFLTAAGTLLFKAIFQIEDSRIYDLFQQCLGKYLPTATDGIRLRLRIEAPEIAALPWEFLYLPGKSVFLGTWISTPLVRYLDVGRAVPNLEMSPPVQMLVVIPDSPDLDADEEKKSLLSALKGMQSHVKPSFLEGKVTLDRVEEALYENEFHILHFIGHGDFDGDQGVLRFTSETVNHEQLGQLFQNLEHMKLVVLNACKGAQVSPSTPFLGIAPQLVKQGIPAVVAMQYSIYDDVAVHFSRRFYQSLFKGKFRGKVDLALTQARSSLRMKYPEERAFGAPVLFLRSPEGVLFHRSLPRTILGILKKIPHLLATTSEAHRLEDAAHTYSYNKSVIEDSDIDAQTKSSRIQEVEEKIKQIYKLLKYQSLAAAAVVAFVMFCLSWVNFFDLAHVDTTMESCTMALGDYFMHKQFTDNIVMIPIDEDTEKELSRQYKKPWAPWRKDHAVLVDHLSEAGAKVIAFDIAFSGPSELESDIALRDAILRAEKRETSVIVGVDTHEEGEPNLVRELRDAGIAWGVRTIGERGYTKLIPLLIRDTQTEEPVVGLALRAFAAYNGAHKIEVVDFDQKENQIIARLDAERQQVRKLSFFETDMISESRHRPGILEKGHMVANLAVDLTRLRRIRDESRRYSYEDIRNPTDPNKLTQLMGKIVIVGVGIERFDDLYGGRWGFQVQADAVNTLLKNVAIRSVAPGEQFVLMVILGILGATIRARTRHVSRRLGISLLVIVLLVYFAGTIYIYAEYRLLLNTVYHAVSLFLTYWVVDKLERRYFK